MRVIELSYKGFLIKMSLSLSDLICLNAAMAAAILLTESFSINQLSAITGNRADMAVATHLLLSLIAVAWFWGGLRHYSYRKPFWFELKEIIRAILIFAVVELAVNAWSGRAFSREIWLMTWLLALPLVPVARCLTRRLLDRCQLWKRQSVIIGSGNNARDTWLALHSEEMLGFEVVAFYDVDGSQPERQLFGVPVLNAESALWAMVNSDTQFVLALEFEQHPARDIWLKHLACRNCQSVSVIPSLRGVPLYGTDMAFIFSHEVMILRVHNNLARFTSRLLKRAFDIVGSLSILVALLPVLILLTLLVARDGGMPIYGHQRVGLNGRTFKCLKFRSMVVNSQAALAEVLRDDPQARAEWQRDFKLKNDPRVTRLGQFMRKTSLDELPQLWNVVRGDMSLVGPRPVVAAELARYAGDSEYYLMAKPGMTGLWQVSGRNDVDYATRVYFDAWYVKNWSLWHDVAILFKTVAVVLKRDGAY